MGKTYKDQEIYRQKQAIRDRATCPHGVPKGQWCETCYLEVQPEARIKRRVREGS